MFAVKTFTKACFELTDPGSGCQPTTINDFVDVALFISAAVNSCERNIQLLALYLIGKTADQRKDDYRKITLECNILNI